MSTRYLIVSCREHWDETAGSKIEAELAIIGLQELFPHYSYSVRPVTEEEVQRHTAPKSPAVHPIFAPIINALLEGPAACRFDDTPCTACMTEVDREP